MTKEMKKREELIRAINAILIELQMGVTVRQVYYQLVSRHVIENNLKSYKLYNYHLTRAREAGSVPDDRFIDTSKPVLVPRTFHDLPTFFQAVRKSYRRDLWQDQPRRVAVLLEKDALRGVIEPITDKYHVRLFIGRGYQSRTNLVKLAEWLREDERAAFLFYFGDCDPSGKDISRSIQDKLKKMGVEFIFRRVALSKEEAEAFNLPPIPTKPSDTRSKKYVAEHGNVAWELDALDPRRLRDMVEEQIVALLDKSKYEASLTQEREEKKRLIETIKDL